MEFSFEDHAYNKLLKKAGISEGDISGQFKRVLIPLALCWLPLAIITLIQGTFWTGDVKSSFITDFNTQPRFLISLPIFILAEKQIKYMLELILNQFGKSGIILKEEYNAFQKIIDQNIKFLKSNWTDIVVFILCYLHVFLVLFYESENTSILSWQIGREGNETYLNLAGKWSTFISRPFFLFMLYRWLLRILIWGRILYKISRLKLNLFAIHPDLSGGLGFLGYGIRYFSPVAFAISATIVGGMADFMIIEGEHITGLKLPTLGYMVFITLLFTLPLVSFSAKLTQAKERTVFNINDFANGIYREFGKAVSKRYDQVCPDDLNSMYYSSVADFSAVVNNALDMKFIPFTLKDLIPLWVMTALPFLGIVLLEIPIMQLFQKVLEVLV